MVAGLVGIKPTVGLTSRNGVIPISRNMDTVGPFGRTVADAVLGLSVIVGRDKRDEATRTPNRPTETDYSQYISDRSVLNGAVFGLPMKRCWELVEDSHKEVASRVFEAIKACGAEILPTDFPSWEERIPEAGHWDWQVYANIQSGGANRFKAIWLTLTIGVYSRQSRRIQ